MFKSKNDPLVDSVKKVMEENAVRRAVEQKVNETFGVVSKKALPHERHAEYDATLASATQKALKEGVESLDESGFTSDNQPKGTTFNSGRSATTKSYPRGSESKTSTPDAKSGTATQGPRGTSGHSFLANKSVSAASGSTPENKAPSSGGSSSSGTAPKGGGLNTSQGIGKSTANDIDSGYAKAAAQYSKPAPAKKGVTVGGPDRKDARAALSSQSSTSPAQANKVAGTSKTKPATARPSNPNITKSQARSAIQRQRGTQAARPAARPAAKAKPARTSANQDFMNNFTREEVEKVPPQVKESFERFLKNSFLKG